MGRNRSRVLDDRLWDSADHGWALQVRWVDADRARQLPGREQDVALSGGVPFRHRPRTLMRS